VEQFIVEKEAGGRFSNPLKILYFGANSELASSKLELFTSFELYLKLVHDIPADFSLGLCCHFDIVF
jgi:hypothetical protein